MDLTKIKIENFKNIHHIEIAFQGKVTRLVGANGAGKSSVIDAIEFLFKGKHKYGVNERFQIIPEDAKKAEITGTIRDTKTGVEYVIKRSVTKKDTVSLTVKSTDGSQLSEADVQNLMSVFSFNPIRFSQLSGKEQALAMGIDTSEYDAEIKKCETSRRDANRDAKNAGIAFDAEENPTGISVSKEEIDRRYKKIDRDDERRKSHENKLYQIARIKEQIDELQKQFRAKAAEIRTIKKTIDEDIEIKTIKEIEAEKETIDAIYRNSVNFVVYAKKEAVRDEAEEVAKHESNRYNEAAAAKLEFVKSSKLPFKEMSIDDDGGLLIQGRKFNDDNYSKGEIITIGVRMLNTKPNDKQVKMLFIPDASLLDPKNMYIVKKISESGIPVVLELVDKGVKIDNSITIREGKIQKDVIE